MQPLQRSAVVKGVKTSPSTTDAEDRPPSRPGPAPLRAMASTATDSRHSAAHRSKRPMSSPISAAAQFPAKRRQLGGISPPPQKLTVGRVHTARTQQLQTDMVADKSPPPERLSYPRWSQAGSLQQIVAREKCPAPQPTSQPTILEGTLQSAVVLAAHLDPVYGYRDPEFNVKAELSHLRDVATQAYSKGTTKAEEGHLKYWTRFCAKRGLRQWRDDHDANSGRDRDGYQREVDILGAFLLELMVTIKPKKGSHRPAALPQSSLNVVYGVRRMHAKQSPPITMVPAQAVKPLMLAATRKYMRTYGYRNLLPRRREPWRNHHIREMLAMRSKPGLQLGTHQVGTSLFWVCFFALQETLTQCGMRSSECIVKKQSDWHPADHLTRASLMWCIQGKIEPSPTKQQLRNLTDADYAILLPPPSKTDAFGVIWGDKPIYLPVRRAAWCCAALRLSEIELKAPLSGEQRHQSPLFCDDLQQPILYSTAYELLNAQKKIVLSKEHDPSLFSFHSFRVYLATALAASGCSDSEIQALCRWQTSASLRIYKRMQPDQACSMLDKAQAAKITSYTAANLPIHSSYQVAQAILDYNSDKGREDSGEGAMECYVQL